MVEGSTNQIEKADRHGASLQEEHQFLTVFNGANQFWFELTMVAYFLFFPVHLEMVQILTDFPNGSKEKNRKLQKYTCYFFYCLLPVDKSVNIWTIPRHAVKTKIYFRFIHHEFCTMLLKYLFLIGHHWKLKSELSDHCTFSQNWIFFLRCM